MVYNALKLFMEINPEMFDGTLQQYKQRKIELVFFSGLVTNVLIKLLSVSNNMQLTDMNNGKKCAKEQYKMLAGSCHMDSERLNDYHRHHLPSATTRIFWNCQWS